MLESISVPLLLLQLKTQTTITYYIRTFVVSNNRYYYSTSIIWGLGGSAQVILHVRSAPSKVNLSCISSIAACPDALALNVTIAQALLRPPLALRMNASSTSPNRSSTCRSSSSVTVREDSRTNTRRSADVTSYPAGAAATAGVVPAQPSAGFGSAHLAIIGLWREEERGRERKGRGGRGGGEREGVCLCVCVSVCLCA
jgi:hypothetical protein